MEKRPADLVAVALLIGFAVLYLLLPSAHYTGDGTLFADVVRHAGGGASAEHARLLLHPHHLLYGPLALGFSRALGAPPADLPHPEILRLSHLSSLLGAAALVIFYLMLRRALASAPLALAFTLLLGVSHSFWYFAESVEVQALALLAGTVFLAALTSAPGRRGAFRVGLAHGFAVLAHLLNGLLVLPALMALRGDRRAVATYALTAGSFVAIAYLVVLPMVHVGGPADLPDYLWPPDPGHYLRLPAVGTFAGSLEGVVLAPPLDAEARTWAATRWLLRVVLAAALLAVLLTRRRGELPEAAARLRSAAWWTLAAYLPLWLLWDAGNPEFLVLGTPAAFALLAVATAARNPRPATRRAVAVLVGVVGVTLGIYHHGARIGPLADPARNPAWVQTEFIRRNSTPEDVILISGVGAYRAGKFYLRYFAERRRFVLDWAILGTGDPDRAVAETRRDMAEAFRAGSRVLVSSEMFEPGTLGVLEQRYGFQRRHGEDLLRGLVRLPVASGTGGLRLWELRPAVAPGSPDS